jgi:hypothetical protein
VISGSARLNWLKHFKVSSILQETFDSTVRYSSAKSSRICRKKLLTVIRPLGAIGTVQFRKGFK